jgi:uncharacterized protein (TIGR03435 family)
MKNAILQMFFVAAPLFSQSTTPAEFDVASVKPNTLNDRIVRIKIGPGGSFTTRGYTLKLLIQQAYAVMGWQISGGAGWLDADRYDISAKALMTGDLDERRLRPLLQRLLADRFQLRVHESTKEMTGYALVVARGGPKLTPTPDGKEHQDTIRMSGIGLRGEGVTMAMLAKMTGGVVGLPVEDKTGIAGVYDIQINWKEQTDQYTHGSPDVDLRNPASASEPVGSNLFTALPDQLGLKLVAQKIQVPMIVIDSAEKASAN